MLTSLALSVLAQAVPPLVDPLPESTSVSTAILKYIIAPALPVLGGVIVWALNALVKYLNAKTAGTRGENTVKTLGELAQSIVADLEVTLRPQIQKALADGTLSKEEAATLKAEALRILKEKAPAGLLATAGTLFGASGLDTWLSGLVERAHGEVNADPAPAPSEAPKNP